MKTVLKKHRSSLTHRDHARGESLRCKLAGRTVDPSTPCRPRRYCHNKIQPQLGSCSRDPIGYVRGLSLLSHGYGYTSGKPLEKRDPLGLYETEDPDDFFEAWVNSLPQHITQNPGWRKIKHGFRYQLSRGCIGAGAMIHGNLANERYGLKNCYATMAEAINKKDLMNANKECEKPDCANMYGKPPVARIFAFGFQNREADGSPEIRFPWVDGDDIIDVWKAIHSRKTKGFNFDFFYQCKDGRWVGGNHSAEKPGALVHIYTKDEVEDLMKNYEIMDAFNAFRYCVDCQIPRSFAVPPTTKGVK